MVTTFYPPFHYGGDATFVRALSRALVERGHEVDVVHCEGTKIYLCQWVVHRQARYYPEPERFDPERFSDARRRERPQFAYFPFGGGGRVCIGEALARMEGVLTLASIAQRFRFELVPGQSIVPEPSMTLRPKGGIAMTAYAR